MQDRIDISRMRETSYSCQERGVMRENLSDITNEISGMWKHIKSACITGERSGRS